MQQQLLPHSSTTSTSTRLCSVSATYNGTPGQLNVTGEGSIRFTPLDANRTMPKSCCCVESSMDVRVHRMGLYVLPHGVVWCVLSKPQDSAVFAGACTHSPCVHSQECAAADVLGATHDGPRVTIWNTRHKAQGHKSFRYVGGHNIFTQSAFAAVVVLHMFYCMHTHCAHHSGM